MTTQAIYYWPDDGWCYKDELHEYNQRSDDYTELHVNADFDEWEIANLVEQRNRVKVNDQYDAERLQTTCKWDETRKAWVCLHCWVPPKTFYIVTGHDHTDDSIWWCPCREKHDGPL